MEGSEMLYPLFLSFHNIWRWVVLIVGIVATVLAFIGWLQKRPWTEQNRKINSFFGIALDIQLLLGLILYIFLSPLTRSFFADIGAAMENADLRFYGLEHFFYMIVAVVLVHLGAVFARRADSDPKKHRNAAIFFTLAFLIILVGIPWARPLFRLPF
jgi:heme/copper-type cytochrome/quinol oxidase subunit 4